MKKAINFKNLLAVLLMLCLYSACETDTSSSSTATAANESAPKVADSESASSTSDSKPYSKVPDTAPTAPSNKVVSWVDNLSIRKEPNLKSEVVTRVKENEELTLTGKKSDFKETIELRGKSYTEPWLEVQTSDGKTGWVFQGGTKSPGEAKGNALNTKTKFTYPHFGAFDLSEWKKVGSQEPDDESDVSVTSTTYQKGSQFLQIDIADSNYYWTKTMKLMDSNKKVIKERTLNIEPGNKEGTWDLTEKVKDFATNKQFSRSETSKKGWYDYKPDMLKGDWKEMATKGGGTSTSDASESSSAKKMSFGTFEFGDCTKQNSKEFDCSCSYSMGDRFKGPTAFLSNMGNSACFKIEGELNSLYPDWEERDYKGDLKKLAKSKHWITLQKSGPMLYFGKELSEHKYSSEMDLIIDVLLASGKKNIKDVTILNNAEGMAIREIRDVVTEAVSQANMFREKGGNDPLSIVKYDNRRYDVIIRTRRITQYEGEADHYDGTMTLLPNRGKKILATANIKGTCGC